MLVHADIKTFREAVKYEMGIDPDFSKTFAGETIENQHKYVKNNFPNAKINPDDHFTLPN